MTQLIHSSEIFHYINKKYYDNLNEDNYYDAIYEAIDDYIVDNTRYVKYIVERYGVLKAIKLYNSQYDNIEFGDDDIKTYQKLAYSIVKEDIEDEYADCNDFKEALEYFKKDYILNTEDIPDLGALSLELNA